MAEIIISLSFPVDLHDTCLCGSFCFAVMICVFTNLEGEKLSTSSLYDMGMAVNLFHLSWVLGIPEAGDKLI